ncbi:hypothetical protein [Crassaminicella indica]|uniref:DUF5673 domain-containing protein n=1 Tax=Crassaminicella indica TaxID=2855394 RepID=A0ABX8RGV6_9CLOT|nr:hypothetical protein [Crassaminicella indica]QXM07145.1 hypothetical protein KVH43_05440 [Crassaminicella indica]
MKKFEDILRIIILILFFIVFIFYRHNVIATCILAVLLWINVIIAIIRIRKNNLPKPNYYIYKPVIVKYLRLIMVIISIILFVKYVFLIATKGFYKEFNGFIIIFTPLLLSNFLNDDRRIYFYDEGLVWCGIILEFNNIKIFQWKEDEVNIHYKNEEYNIKVPKTKFEHVDKILKENINL